MNIQKISVRWYALVVMLGLCYVQTPLRGMEELVEKGIFESTEAGFKVAEGGAEKAVQESLGITEEAFNGLSAEVKTELVDSFKSELGDFVKSFDAAGEMGIPFDVSTNFESSLKTANEVSFANVKEIELSPDDYTNLSKAKFEGVENVANELTVSEPLDPKYAAADEAKGNLIKANSDLEAAQKAVDEFKGDPLTDPEYQTLQDNLTAAQDAADTALKDYGTALDEVTALTDTDVVTKTQASDAAAKKTETAAKSGSKTELDTAKTEEAKADSDTNKAKKGKGEADTKSYRAKRDAANTEYKAKKAAYNKEKAFNDEIENMQKAQTKGTLDDYINGQDENIKTWQEDIDALNKKLDDPATAEGDKAGLKEDIKSKQERIDEANRYKTTAETAKAAEDPAKSLTDAKTASDTKVTEAKAAKKKAYDTYKDVYKDSLEKTTVWGSLKNGDFKTIGYKGIEWGKKLGLGSIEQAVGGVFFAVGAAAISAVETAWANKKLKDSLKQVQNFGNVYMRVPDDLINTSDPANSAFVYVGIKVTDLSKPNDFGVQANTPADLNVNYGTDAQPKPANFYVSYDESGDWGTAYIGGTTFPDTMVHLNTGYKFAGNGEPADLEDPLISYFPQTADTQSVISQSINLSGVVVGGVIAETTTFFVSKSSSFDGDQVISDLLNADANDPYNPYEGDQYSFPVTLQASIDTLRTPNDSISFGNIKLIEMQPLNGDNINELSKAKALDSSTYDKIGVLPYVSLEIYAYQTHDTALVQTGVLKGTGLPDIVVALNDLDQVLPAHAIDTSGTYGFAQFGFNPDVKKVCSLLDGTVYNVNGEPSGELSPTLPTTFASFDNQINALKTYVEEKEKYGPFTYGTIQLVTEKEWADAEIPVYKIVGGLNVTDANGVALDDYVIPISMVLGPHAVMLPQPEPAFNYLLSMITSMFYAYKSVDENGQLLPVSLREIIPADNTAPCSVCQTQDGNFRVTTGCASGETQVYYDSAVSFSVMFMDADINPVAINPANYKVSDIDLGDWLPVPYQWALTYSLIISGDDSTVKLPLETALVSAGQTDLLDTINSVYQTWKGIYISKMDPTRAVANEVGPFKWSMDVTVPMYIKATSLGDIEKGIYVYQLAKYSDEYVIVANSTNVPTSLQQFNLAAPQQYAISLSSGLIYDGKNSGAPVLDTTGLPKKIDPATALQSLTVIAQNSDLYNKISQSQGKYKQNLTNNRKYYGQSTVFLFPEDEANGQYIYADVTGISDFANQYVAGTLLSNVKDFFVFSDDGKVYGMPCSNKTTYGASVVSGSVFNRSQYVGRYTSEDVQAIDITGLPTYIQSDLLQYQKDLLDMVSAQAAIITKKASNPIREAVITQIGTLTAPLYNIVLTQQQELEEAAAQRAALNPPLDAGAANLDSVDYEPDTIFGPQYIKYYAPTGKYYFVSPTVPETGGTKYIDFNAGTAGADTKLVMLYDNNGDPLNPIIDSYLVATMRMKNGVYVSSDGTQSLGMPIDNPGIPVAQMVELDATTLSTQLDSAQSAFTTAFDAFVKGSGSSDALQTAALALGRAKISYQSALAVQAQESQVSASAPTGSTFEFYINQEINHYYVLVTTSDDTYYIDLLMGFEYNVDGTPRFTKNAVFKNLYGAQDELFYRFAAVDMVPSPAIASTEQDPLNPASSLSLLGLVYTGTDGVSLTYSQDGPSTKVRNEFLITDFYPGVTFSPQGSEQVIRYDMSSIMPQYTVDEEGDEVPMPYPDLKVYQNDPTYTVPNQITKFAINEIVTDELGEIVDTIFTGSYTPEAGVYSMMPLYYQTRTGSDVVMTDSTMFAQQPLVLVWDGGSDFNLQRVLYKGQMVTLSGSGSTYSAGSVQITVQKDDASLAQWLTVTDGSAEYDFLLDSEIAAISDQKQTWGLNIVTNAQGQSQLVNALPSALKSVSISADYFIDYNQFTTVGTLQNSRATVITANLEKVKYDSTYQRYVYKLSSDYDSGQPYYADNWNGWYVDLLTGILYDLYDYPQVAMSLDQLWMLLNSIEMNVVYADQTTLKLAYRSACNIVMQDIAQGLPVDQSDKDKCNILSQ